MRHCTGGIRGGILDQRSPRPIRAEQAPVRNVRQGRRQDHDHCRRRWNRCTGVATFCKVSYDNNESNNIALPVAAEEGFTGLLSSSRAGEDGGDGSWLGSYEAVLSVEGYSKQDLLDLDNEGRCLVRHFVLFNIYGPNVGCGDTDRHDFKLNFYKALQCRLDNIVKQGRRVIIVGDLNISPYPIDSCDPGPNFDSNLSRLWFRSMLVSNGGAFSDVFCMFHPERSLHLLVSSIGLNYGTRIDHILIAGPCSGYCQAASASDSAAACSGFAQCGTKNCDILYEYKRAKLDTLPRWSA